MVSGGTVGHAGERRGARGERRWRPWAQLLLLALVVGLVPRATAAEWSGVVDATSAVNLRAEPGAWAPAVGELYGGQGVTLVAGPTGDGWYQIDAGGQVGWVHGWYLLIDGALGWAAPPAAGLTEPAAPVAEQGTIEAAPATPLDPLAAIDPAGGGPDPAAPGQTAWVAVDGLNVRESPVDGAGVLGVAGSGEPLTITGEAINGFVPITSWIGPGWVWGELLNYQATDLGVGGPTGDFGGPPPDPPAPLVPPVGPPLAPAPLERWIDVNRSAQTVTLFDGGQPIATYWGAMGRDQSADGFFATAVGTYYVYEKYRDLSWTVWGNAWVRNWVGFDPNRLNGFHSYSMDWTGQVLPDGAGPTNGCVALDPDASSVLFDFAAVGTRVEVHW